MAVIRRLIGRETPRATPPLTCRLKRRPSVLSAQQPGNELLRHIGNSGQPVRRIGRVSFLTIP